MNNDLQHKAYQMVFFNALATSGSLTKAAEKLGVSVSHVSKQITTLEENLNVQLVNRSTRNMALTAEGKEYAEYCGKIVNLIQTANSMMIDSRDELSGNVRLALSCSFGTIHILPALDKLQKLYPSLTIEVSLLDYKIDMLEENIDLWFTTCKEINPSYVAQRIQDSEFILLAAPNYIAEAGKPSHPADLQSHNCVTYHSKNRRYNQWGFSKESEQIEVEVSGNFRVDKAEAVRDAVLAGRGIGYIASYLLTDEIESGKLVPLLTDWTPTLQMPVYAVYPKFQNLPNRLKTIINFIKESIK